jgi:hypothetical protein
MEEEEGAIFNERGFLKRTCRLQKKEIEEEEYSDLEVEEGEITDDPESDEDYDPNKPLPRKKKKKILKSTVKEKVRDDAEEYEKARKVRRQKKKPEFKPPSYDQVMGLQISHLAKFIKYQEEYESYKEQSTSEYEEEIIQVPVQRKQRSPTPEFIPMKERKKRVVIYPWRPIGITSGCDGVEESYLITRPPVNDVRKLIEIENIF